MDIVLLKFYIQKMENYHIKVMYLVLDLYFTI
jgi:hypothetical protein